MATSRDGTRLAPWAAAAALAALVLGGPPAAAAGQGRADPAAATFAVDLEARGVPAWRASALETAIARGLGSVDRLEVQRRPAGDAARCPAGDLACRAAALREGGVDVALVGTLFAARLDYELHLGWTPAAPPLARGAIELAGADVRSFTDQLRAALDPVLRADGALDRRGSPRAADAPAAIAAPGAAGARIALVAAAVALFLALPLCLGALGLRGRGLAALLRLRSFRFTALAWVGLGLAAYLASAHGQALASASFAILVAGGLAWGWLVAANLPVLFPPLRGLERVEHADLFRILRAWTLVSLLRVAQLAVFYGPAAALGYWACGALGVPWQVGLGVIAPVGGLLLHLWFLSAVDSAAMLLDGALVSGEATADNPWDAAVRGYLLGYVRRTGWPPDDTLLDDVLLLPGEGDQITVYGGGLTHARIVIGTELLEFALAPCERPHDYAVPRVSKLAWTEWNAGLVVPLEVTDTIATRADRQPRETAIAGEMEHQPLGEPPTLAGYVEPYTLDTRGAHLPSEDPLWLDWDPTEEFDGTDASDKDFLFGALVHALGRIQRHDDRLLSLLHLGRRWLGGRRPWLARLVARLTRPYEALLSRYPALLDDAYVALNFGRHHLLQYLAWRRWGRDDLLTARANVPQLEQSSAAILRELAQSARPQARGVTPHDRLVWLSEFLRAPVRSRRAVVYRRAALAGVVVAAGAALALGIVRAVEYHPTYLERLERERQRGAPTPPEPAPLDEKGPTDGDRDQR